MLKVVVVVVVIERVLYVRGGCKSGTGHSRQSLRRALHDDFEMMTVTVSVNDMLMQFIILLLMLLSWLVTVDYL